MPKSTYIDNHQLGPRILKMSGDGMSDTKIAETLKEEGFKVSQPTVSRWLKDKREVMGRQVQGIVQEHLQKELPKDLDVLESMEALTYAWAMESAELFVGKLMEEDWLQGAHARWDGMLSETGEDKDPLAGVKAIVREVFNRAVKFLDVRKEKLAYIKSTREDIGLKLQYAGIIDGATSGNIYIVTNKKDGMPGQPGGNQTTEPGERPRLRMVLKGGGSQNGA